MVPGLVTYRGQAPEGVACVAAVDTVRGQLTFIVDGGFTSAGLSELCESAVQIVEEFYQK